MNTVSASTHPIHMKGLQLPIVYPKGMDGDLRVGEIQLVYQNEVRSKDRVKVCSSRDMADLFRSNWSCGTMELREEFKVAIFNRSNEVLGICNLFQGGLSSTPVDNRLILIAALRVNGISIAVCHNHPSGNLKASKSDIDLTRTLKDACRLLHIELLDHIILTHEGYTSFADEGLM